MADTLKTDMARLLLDNYKELFFRNAKNGRDLWLSIIQVCGSSYKASGGAQINCVPV